MLNTKTLFIIDQKKGLGLEFSKLVSMMDYARVTTIDAVENLTVEELDFLYDEDANSIGMLLAHMVSVEKVYQILTFENRDITQEEIGIVNPRFVLGTDAPEKRSREIPSIFILSQLVTARNETIESFKTLPEDWLFEQTPFWNGNLSNNYFKWFHVFEDEINHRGQIRIIKKMMKKKQGKD